MIAAGKETLVAPGYASPKAEANFDFAFSGGGYLFRISANWPTADPSVVRGGIILVHTGFPAIEPKMGPIRYRTGPAKFGRGCLKRPDQTGLNSLCLPMGKTLPSMLKTH